MSDEPEAPSAADRAEYLDRLARELERDDLLAEVAKRARAHVPVLRKYGIACGPKMHEELVQDAVSETIEGTRRWDGEVELAVFLRGVIRSRVNAMIKHAKKFRKTALDEAWANDESSPGEDAQEAKVSHAAEPWAPRVGRALSLKDAAHRLLAGVRAAAPTDLPIRRVLDAWERGHVDRAEGIAESGLTPALYDAACKRIKVIALALPEDLVTGTVDALEVSYGG